MRLNSNQIRPSVYSWWKIIAIYKKKKKPKKATLIIIEKALIQALRIKI